MMNLILSGPRVYTEEGVIENGAVAIKDELIQEIHQGGKKVQATQAVEFPPSFHIIPGFIDLHTHGANNHDVMDATPAALAGICQALAREGTTAFLATTMTADVREIEEAVTAVGNFMQSPQNKMGAKILGVHLEGPFLAESKMGAQRGDKIILPDLDFLQRLEKISHHAIRLVTLAPEQKNSLAMISYLKKHNIISSLGHTDATYAEAMLAIDAGTSYATHLFNAMRGLHHREPGAVTAALLSDNVTAELIVDGFHLHPAIVKLALKMKGKEKIVLVTDAMRAKCMADGCYDLGGQEVQVMKGRAQLANGTLAGSVLEMSSAIQNMLDFTGCELVDAVSMASENPARILKVFDRKGSIKVGKDADLVVLNDELHVVLTVSGGKVVYSVASPYAKHYDFS